MEPKPIHLSVKSHPENLIRIRETVSGALSDPHVSEETVGKIILAVDEACSNIIRHSYKNDHSRDIDLTFHLSGDALTIIIMDNGVEFDLNTVEERDIKDVKPGGLGLYIIKQVMDSFEYSRTEDGYNRVKLVKKI